jgi:hypothetical protein
MTDWVLGGRQRNIFHGPRPGAIVPLVDPPFWLSSHVWGNCCQLMIRLQQRALGTCATLVWVAHRIGGRAGGVTGVTGVRACGGEGVIHSQLRLFLPPQGESFCSGGLLVDPSGVFSTPCCSPGTPSRSRSSGRHPPGLLVLGSTESRALLRSTSVHLLRLRQCSSIGYYTRLDTTEISLTRTRSSSRQL